MRTDKPHIIKKPFSLDVEIRQKIIHLDGEVNFSKMLRKSRNELLSGSAYHEKNMERQLSNMENAKAPKNELNLIKKSWSAQHKLNNKMWKDYEEIVNLINKQIIQSNKVKHSVKST